MLNTRGLQTDRLSWVSDTRPLGGRGGRAEEGERGERLSIFFRARVGTASVKCDTGKPRANRGANRPGKGKPRRVSTRVGVLRVNRARISVDRGGLGEEG